MNGVFLILIGLVVIVLPALAILGVALLPFVRRFARKNEAFRYLIISDFMLITLLVYVAGAGYVTARTDWTFFCMAVGDNFVTAPTSRCESEGMLSIEDHVINELTLRASVPYMFQPTCFTSEITCEMTDTLQSAENRDSTWMTSWLVGIIAMFITGFFVYRILRDPRKSLESHNGVSDVISWDT